MFIIMGPPYVLVCGKIEELAAGSCRGSFFWLREFIRKVS